MDLVQGPWPGDNEPEQQADDAVAEPLKVEFHPAWHGPRYMPVFDPEWEDDETEPRVYTPEQEAALKHMCDILAEGLREPFNPQPQPLRLTGGGPGGPLSPPCGGTTD